MKLTRRAPSRTVVLRPVKSALQAACPTSTTRSCPGGEKAAFDILLDVFVKRDEAGEAVFCIDEPELRVATDLQGPLIASILGLLPEPTQLWSATHSIGIVREAYRMQQERPGEVAFLDFSGRAFDAPVTIAPSTPNRMFWENTYQGRARRPVVPGGPAARRHLRRQQGQARRRL